MLLTPDDFKTPVKTPASYLEDLYLAWSGGDQHTNSLAKLFKIMNIEGTSHHFYKMMAGKRSMKFTAFISAARVMLGAERKKELKESVEVFYPHMSREVNYLNYEVGKIENRAGLFKSSLMREMYIRITSAPMKISYIIGKWGEEGEKNISRLTEMGRFSVKDGEIALAEGKEGIDGDNLIYDLFMHNVGSVGPDDMGTGENRQTRQSGYLSSEDKRELNCKLTDLMNWVKTRQNSKLEGVGELVTFQTLIRTHK